MDEVEQLLFEGLDAVIYCDTADCYEMPVHSHACGSCERVTLLCHTHTQAMNHYARTILLLGQPIACSNCSNTFAYPLVWVDL